jgi:uncharacterized lipoprotein YehR (DUF1307 family)
MHVKMQEKEKASKNACKQSNKYENTKTVREKVIQ